jgi:hypothetical protein
MKWLVRTVCVTVAIVGVIYMTSSKPYSDEYCLARLNDLKIYRAGETPAHAPDTERSTRAIVAICAEQNKQFAEISSPYL